MEWNFIRYNINSNKIETFNIFKHYSFKKEVDEILKTAKSREEFDDRLNRALMYYFWCKSEWEVLITPWLGNREKEVKVDVYWQVMNNKDKFFDYVWSFKR